MEKIGVFFSPFGHALTCEEVLWQCKVAHCRAWARNTRHDVGVQNKCLLFVDCERNRVKNTRNLEKVPMSGELTLDVATGRTVSMGELRKCALDSPWSIL